MTDETILSGLSRFQASRNYIATSAGSTVDLITTADTASDRWQVTQVGDHIGFITDGGGLRRLKITQGGIYFFTMSIKTIPTYADVGSSDFHVNIPSYFPQVDITVSDFQSGTWTPINFTALVRDAGGQVNISMYRSWTAGRAEPLNTASSTGLNISIVELVPQDGFASSDAPATTNPGTLTAASRNVVTRFT